MEYCPKCGNEVLEEATVCPSCGCAVKKEAVAFKKVVPKSAKTALVFGILSILVLAPFGIPAIVLANKSKNETGGIMCKQAKTGLVCGIIGLCWWGICLILFY